MKLWWGTYSNVLRQHHQTDPSAILFEFFSYRGVCCVQIDKFSLYGIHYKYKNDFSLINVTYSETWVLRTLYFVRFVSIFDVVFIYKLSVASLFTKSSFFNLSTLRFVLFLMDVIFINLNNQQLWFSFKKSYSYLYYFYFFKEKKSLDCDSHQRWLRISFCF